MLITDEQKKVNVLVNWLVSSGTDYVKTSTGFHGEQEKKILAI